MLSRAKTKSNIGIDVAYIRTSAGHLVAVVDGDRYVPRGVGIRVDPPPSMVTVGLMGRSGAGVPPDPCGAAGFAVLVAGVCRGKCRMTCTSKWFNVVG
jgi:hypothetical protein